MTLRELPSSDWHRLADTELGPVLDLLDPRTTIVLVVESEDGQIIGCHSAGTYVHLEGWWIHPDHRKKASVARRLWAGMQSVLSKFGAQGAITCATTDDVASYITRAGGRLLPGEHYYLPLRRSYTSH